LPHTNTKLKGVYNDASKFENSVGQWCGIVLCEPYSGHGHPTNTPVGVQHFQQLGLCNFFYGPPDPEVWRDVISRANGTWQFATVQFDNATFLCMTVNDVTIDRDLVISHDLEKLHKTVSEHSSYSLERTTVVKSNLEVKHESPPSEYWVKTRNECIYFHIKNVPNLAFDKDLSGTAIKFEDMVATLIFQKKLKRQWGASYMLFKNATKNACTATTNSFSRNARLLTTTQAKLSVDTSGKLFMNGHSSFLYDVLLKKRE
jgi:hypothetical protein